MSVKVSLLIDGIEANVLEYDFTFNQQIDANNRPSGIPKFEGINIKIESQKAIHLAPWAIADSQTKQLQLIISPVTQTGKTRTLHLFDCHLVGWNNHFSSTGTSPKTETLRLTCGGVRENADTLEYSAPWRETFDVAPPENEEEEEEKTVIDSIVWVNADSKEENIKELIYTQNASLKVKITNPTGAAATFVIKKEDGNEFENGDLEIKFTETVEADGTVELKPFTIKTKWEELKVAKTDKLIAEVTHNKESKKSDPLELLPSPKVLASFRPENSWKGEFGFDWIRTGDTSLFKDVKFESIISKQYTNATHTTLQLDHNEYGGSFKKDPAQFEKLKKEYKPIEVKWRKVNDATGKKVNDKHCTEWLSLKNGKEAKVKIHIDVTDKADYLEFDSNANFTISPKKIDIKNKKGKKKLKDVITIKCIKEFAGDQEIIVKAFKEPLKDGVPAGKINVWANNAAKHKQKKVVFVQIKTDLKGKGLLKTANAKPEKPRINQYLEQAYIELHPDSTIIDLDLSADADFAKFVKGGKVRKSIPAVAGKAEVPEVKAVAATATTPAVLAKPAIPAVPAIPEKYLSKLLRKKLYALDAKYKSRTFFKAFYFAEEGITSKGKKLSGFSAHNADYVVVFKSRNDQSAVHEFLHSFNLAHTFTNIESSGTAKYTYEAKQTDNLLDYSHNLSPYPSDPDHNNNKRCSLYYWQWQIANKAIT